jgi:two-component system sensor histidine kinase TctE
MLTEAISNLVENAMAYSHATTDITIRINNNTHWAEVWVIDKGPGIKTETQDQATHRFYRVPGTKATGCGLGLAIVSEIAKSFNGELFFDGPEDNHFAIGIRLPLHPITL